MKIVYNILDTLKTISVKLIEKFCLNHLVYGPIIRNVIGRLLSSKVHILSTCRLLRRRCALRHIRRKPKNHLV